MIKSAVLSEDGKYRYRLSRSWGDGPKVGFVMLNPSTADAEVDDPTIRRCVNFAKAWGYDGIEVVNLFAYRSTKPSFLDSDYFFHPEGGERGDEEIVAFCKDVDLIVAAWGAHGHRRLRDELVLGLIRSQGKPVHVLGLTKDGKPRHPLYLSKDLKPVEWKA